MRFKGQATTQDPAQGGDATFQFIIDLVELIGSMKLVSGDPEAAQNAHEQKGEPQLQSPTDGMGEHGHDAVLQVHSMQ